MKYAEVVIDRGAFLLVLAVDEESARDSTVYLLELPREPAPSDLSPSNARQCLTQLRSYGANRRRAPEQECRTVSTPDEYTFPVDMDTAGRRRLVVSRAG